ncbi:capsular polysaccharide synthesis protein [Prevotella sp. kh1p2]|uniref:capsular polysaccharide synthesis protein n=1 Tax=Prevotella sp. kh1p2 TaxID=1761883 RepID=UPI0015A57AB8|nr:capsular polysaccharide synthesis protein [Prevotella sp. kh1p2]
MKDIILDISEFGVGYALKIRILPRMCSLFKKVSYNYTYNLIICKYLKKSLFPIIAKYKNHDARVVREKSRYVWLCWWQGKDEMPELVKKCYQSVIEKFAGCNVVVVTAQNYKGYVDIPDSIDEKWHKKKISYAHMSDILRCSLLAKYGGLWIDATYWVVKSPNVTFSPFFSTKQHYDKDSLVSGCRWTGSLMGCDEGYYVFECLRECLFAYWEQHERIIHYFLMDYIMNIFYHEFADFRQAIDQLPYSNEELHVMKHIFNTPFDENRWKLLIATNDFFKLSWKEKYYTHTKQGHLTYYGYFMS